MSYFSGHNHSHYSNIRMYDCIVKETDLIDYAMELGLNGVAITDHESLGAHVKMIKHMKKIQEDNEKNFSETMTVEEKEKYNYVKNFKMGLGNEIYLCRDNLNGDTFNKGIDKFYHFILIAKDAVGHQQLRELSSAAWEHSFKSFMIRVPTYYRDVERIIGNNPGHIVAQTACLGGQFPKLLMEAISTNDFSKVNNFVNWCINVFGKDNFFIEIQPGLSEEQIVFNKYAVDYAKKNNLKFVVTTDTHYLKAEDRGIHKSFLNANDGDREVDDFYSYTYMMSTEEIIDKLQKSISKEDAETAIENTKLVGDMITFYDLEHFQKVPRVVYDWSTIEKNHIVSEKYPYILKFFHSDYEDDKFFINAVFTKAEKINLLDEKHLERLEQECGEIWEVSEKISERLSAYFLTIQKIVDIGWNDADTLIGPWRGSAGSLLTAYLLDIIQADPLDAPTDLPYWR